MRLEQATVRGSNNRVILGPVTIEFGPGEWVNVIGPNGAGKSTLCNVICGATKLASGTAELDLPVGYLPQAPHRPVGLTTLEYSLLGSTPLGDAGVDAVARASEALDLCGLEAAQPVETLSGGEFRKAGIARLMTTDLSVFVLDEPSAGLDPQARIEVFELLEKIRMDRTVIAVMHDLGVASQFGERFVVLEDGLVTADGPSSRIMRPGLLSRVFGSAVTVVEIDGSMFPIVRR